MNAKRLATVKKKKKNLIYITVFLVSQLISTADVIVQAETAFIHQYSLSFNPCDTSILPLLTKASESKHFPINSQWHS